MLYFTLYFWIVDLIVFHIHCMLNFISFTLTCSINFYPVLLITSYVRITYNILNLFFCFFLNLKSEGRGSSSALQHMISDCNVQISNLVSLSNSKLRKSDRQRVCNLIIQDSHNKDTVQLLVDRNCCDRSDFVWQSKFRPRITLEVPAKAVSEKKLDVAQLSFVKCLKIFENL